GAPAADSGREGRLFPRAAAHLPADAQPIKTEMRTNMAGSLYVVGTPIGNLEDMSVRAVRTLQEADFIAAEDTRVTLKLLNHFAIKKPMLSYHEHNARQK